jgi:hypothetical protein
LSDGYFSHDFRPSMVVRNKWAIHDHLILELSHMFCIALKLLPVTRFYMEADNTKEDESCIPIGFYDQVRTRRTTNVSAPFVDKV